MAESKSEKKPKVTQPNPVTKYLRETRGELRKVTWPTREESLRLTSIVLAVTLAMTFLMWMFDLLFAGGMRLLLKVFLGV